MFYTKKAHIKTVWQLLFCSFVHFMLPESHIKCLLFLSPFDLGCRVAAATVDENNSFQLVMLENVERMKNYGRLERSFCMSLYISRKCLRKVNLLLINEVLCS